MEYLFNRSMETGVQFSYENGRLSLLHLFGLDCGRCRQPAGSSLFGGLVCLDTGDGKIDTDSLEAHECSYNGEELTVVWKLQHSLLLKSRWSFCRETGVLHRRDTLENTGACAVMIYSAGTRLVFTPGNYEIYSQASSWNNENQGVWQKLHHGSIRLRCEGGRTTQGGSPFMVLKESTSGKAAVFQLIPEGNWSMSVAAMTGPGDSRPYAIVEAGMADSRLRMSLAAGETLKLPELLMYAADTARLSGAASGLDFNAWKLHTYYLKNMYSMKFEEPPIVYNTWFDVFEFLDVPRLRAQAEVARKLGCEVFVIDAGWYGREGDWFSQAGDWREKEHAAFYGKMAEFAEEVRAQGMGFGLWMEPERIGAGTPVKKQHPEWFLPGGSGFYYPDLANPQAYDHILGEICRLIEKYKLAWMKIDFNFDLGLDPKGQEFKQYYAAWYSMLDRIRGKYPGFFLEGCASGGMRLDLNTLGRFDGHFLSDNVNPWDVLSIYQGALLRLPPGLVIKWVAMRSTGGGIVKYGLPLAEAPRGVIVPEGATWDRSGTADADFPMKVAMAGMMGLTGDFSGMDEMQLETVAANIRFYKQWRSFIRSSRAYLLTPPVDRGCRSGWAGIQLQGLEGDKNLLFAYRLEDSSDRCNFYPQGLKEDGKYRIYTAGIHCDPVELLREQTGKRLMKDGFLTEIGGRNEGAVYIIEEE